jgi:DNA-binding transcriptional MerR regulator
MKIGELAKLARVGVETVRFYQRRGLLPVPPKRPGGTREYSDALLLDLQVIRRCVALGLTLEQARALMKLRRVPRGSCRAIHEQLRQAASQLEHERRVLEGRLLAVERLLAACATPGRIDACALLRALEIDPGITPA